MIALRLNDKPYKSASCWQEVKTRQYVRILKEWDPDKDIADRDYFKLLCILTDAPFKLVEESLENQVTLTSILGWVITQPFKFSEVLPKVLQFKDQTIDIPRHPRDLSIGQTIHLRREIEKTTILEENISIAVAIFLQPKLDNALFNIDRAKEIAKEIDEMPIDLIYPIGFFLLKKITSFGQKPLKTFPLIPISLNETLKKLFLRWRKSIS